LVKRAHSGELQELLPTGNELPPGAGLSAQALATGRSVIVDNVQTAPGYVAGLAGVASEMCLPLVAHGQTLGVLVLDSARPAAFRPPDTEALQSVADMCAIAIQNAHSFERVQQMAEIDGLTGIYNRRHLERRLVAELERMARYQHGMAVLMVDIDHFKRVNDEFGHLLGDEVLRHISVVLTRSLRKLDILCRYGGEEFAILLPETTAENAVNVAEKLRRKIEAHNFAGVPRPVTVSIGHADYPKHGVTRDELIKAADAALYAAKQAGRNRVISYGAMPATTAKAAPVE
jgi:diguanylate cyclase (GGDEF)-like protein